MRRTNRAFIGRIFTENRILLFVNFCVLCFVCGDEIGEYRGTGINAFGYILAVITNHYYILYGMLPILLLLIARYIKNISDIEIIRYRNAFCHIRRLTTQFVAWIAVYLVANLIIAFVVGLTSFPVFFDQTLIDSFAYDELIILLNEYVGFFGNTIVAIIAVIVYMLFGFTVLISLLSYINHKLGYKKMIFAAIAIYLFTFIGFKSELKTIVPVICLNNYILLHHALFVNGGIRFVLILLVGVLTISFCFGKRIGARQYSVDEFILSKRELGIALSVPIIFVLLELLRSSTAEGFSTKNVIANVFIGTSGQSSAFTWWLELTILYMTPVFLIGVSNSRLKQYGQLPLLIRFKNKSDFVRKADKRYVKLLLLYILVMAIVGNTLLLIPTDTAEGSDYLQEVFGTGFSDRMFNLYLTVFGAYLIFDFILFRCLNGRMGSIAALILILICKFVFFWLPNINYLLFNFGLINLYENIGNGYGLLLRIAASSAAAVLYFSTNFVRRLCNGNN